MLIKIMAHLNRIGSNAESSYYILQKSVYDLHLQLSFNRVKHSSGKRSLAASIKAFFKQN